MTIHRTRVGIPPDGGAEEGRQIDEILPGIFVEWSGVKPTTAEVQDHINPPPVPPENTPTQPDDIIRLLKALAVELGTTPANIDNALIQAKKDRP